MRVIIAGGRDFKDYAQLCRVCDDILPEFENVSIVSGRCRGADRLGERYAEERGYKIKRMPADWNDMSEPCIVGYRKDGSTYNKCAGFKRNTKMAKHSDGLIAFWNNKSRGTKNMISEARKEELMTVVAFY